MICINCFSNYGFRHTIEKFGTRAFLICDNCRNPGWVFVNSNNVENILQEFFFEGTISPQYRHPIFRVIEAIEGNFENDFIDYTITEDVKKDLNLVKKFFNNTVYTPLINMRHGWGDTLLRWEIQNSIDKLPASKDKLEQVLDLLINCCKKIHLKKGDLLFRIRKNPVKPHSLDEFDPPRPELLKIAGRFNGEGFPLFYCSNDPETCIYESKFDPTDTIVLATFKVNKEIEIVDLENTDASYIESLDSNLREIFKENDIRLFLDAVTRSTKEYNLLKFISTRIYQRSFRGFKYTSFFNRYRDEEFNNLGIFGYPLKDDLVELISLNNVVINKVNISWKLGPCLGSLNVDDNLEPLDE